MLVMPNNKYKTLMLKVKDIYSLKQILTAEELLPLDYQDCLEMLKKEHLFKDYWKDILLSLFKKKWKIIKCYNFNYLVDSTCTRCFPNVEMLTEHFRILRKQYYPSLCNDLHLYSSTANIDSFDYYNDKRYTPCEPSLFQKKIYNFSKKWLCLLEELYTPLTDFTKWYIPEVLDVFIKEKLRDPNVIETEILNCRTRHNSLVSPSVVKFKLSDIWNRLFCDQRSTKEMLKKILNSKEFNFCCSGDGVYLVDKYKLRAFPNLPCLFTHMIILKLEKSTLQNDST